MLGMGRASKGRQWIAVEGKGITWGGEGIAGQRDGMDGQRERERERERLMWRVDFWGGRL